jgi:hypothetical protein
MFLFLLAALMVPLFASKIGAVDSKKEQSTFETLATSDFSVSVNMLGEKDGVYKPGEEIRLSFQTTKDAYVVVYNVDANGYVSLLYPEDGRPVLSKGLTTYFLPPPGKDLIWETGRTTGVEYIHALAVTEPGRLNEDELLFLSRGDRLPEEKRLRIDTDPYLAFNTIDGEIVRDAESDPPATDFEHFFVNKRVDYPRYLCSKCHSPEKLPDPYAMECPEIIIEEIAYENEPNYPYPPLYDVRHVGEAKGDNYSSGGYADSWLDEEDDETQVNMTISYEDYNPYAPYYGASLFFYDPFWWGYGWGWGFGWGWGYGCGYGYGYGYGGCYPPYYYSQYPYWDCGYGYGYGNCHGGYDPYYGYDHPYSPVSGERTLAKRQLDYARTNADLHQTRTLKGSRLAETRNRDLARNIERSNLQRRSGDLARNIGRSNLQRRSVDRNLASGTIRRSERSTVRNREMERKVIYGGERAVASMRQTRDANRSVGTGGTGRLQETLREQSARTQQRIDSRRSRDAVRREQQRAVDRGSEPQRESGDGDRNESTRSGSSGSSTSGRSHSVDRGSSGGGSHSSPARSSGAPARGGSSGRGSSGGSSRSSGAPSGHRR